MTIFFSFHPPARDANVAQRVSVSFVLRGARMSEADHAVAIGRAAAIPAAPIRRTRGMIARRSAPPWSVDELVERFVVRDANGHALAHVYFEEKPERRAAAHMLNRDEARRIAAHIAKLPELLASRDLSRRNASA
jgi:hypothetical protein